MAQRNGEVEANVLENSEVNKPSNQFFVIHILKNFQISINKPLLPLRMTLFLWYGVGAIALVYFTVFMKQKGMSLVQYSSIFSVTFVFQLVSAFVSGIVADKIGNAKPVLMFHILMSLLIVLGFLCTPRLNVYDRTPGDNSTANNVLNLADNLYDSCHTLSRSFSFHYSNDTVNDTVFESTDIPPLLSIDHDVNYTATKSTADDEDIVWQNRNYLMIYIALSIAFFSSISTTYRFMDVTVMSFVDKYDINFGQERFFSMSGGCVISLLGGVVLDLFTLKGEENNYEAVYWFLTFTLILILIVVHNMSPQIKPQSYNMLKNVLVFLRNRDFVIFLFVLLILGSCFNFTENFSLWFLEYLNSQPMLLGLYQPVMTLYGLPIFFTARWWLETFGPIKLVLAAFLGHFIGLIGYSFVYNPWWVLAVELTWILSYHLLWMAVVVYSHHIAPEGMEATVVALAGAVHYGIGRSTGNVIGGLAINAYGPRMTFRIFAGISFLSGVLYAGYLWWTKPDKKRYSKQTQIEV